MKSNFSKKNIVNDLLIPTKISETKKKIPFNIEMKHSQTSFLLPSREYDIY